MHYLDNLRLGLSVALSPGNFLYCLIGAVIGTVVGVLPGLGPVTTIAMLLPLTFKIPAIASLIMLAGIYYGAHHAGSTTAIMLNMPGDPSSVVICFDGHPMARQGRAGPALCISALSSFFAGSVAVIAILFLSPLLSSVALSFGPAEYASMVLLALLATAVLSGGSLLINVPMVLVGVLLGTVGMDVNSGVERFTFGIGSIADGLDFVTIAVGIFAIAEIVGRAALPPPPASPTAKIKSLLPARADLAASWRAILRGTGIGAVLGILPGTGPLVSSFASYNVEKQLSRTPEEFGRGAIAGVAGPEAANNAAALTHFIPMLTLGIPAGAAMALMLGALIIQGIQPGPAVATQHPDLFWGVIVSMWVGNLMLLVLNLPMVGLWIRLLMIPYRLLYPAILVFCCIGVYSVANSTISVFLAAGFGVFGYIMRVLGCQPAPLILGFILAPVLEVNLRRAMLLSQGDPTVFVTHPISLLFLTLTAAVVVFSGVGAWRRRRIEPALPLTGRELG
jgi:putative tricarboxylic transport membrane protein